MIFKVSDTHYIILGIEQAATTEEIKQAYRREASKHHPDHNQNDPAAADRFRKATEAYRILSNEETRKQYDFEISILVRSQRARRVSNVHTSSTYFNNDFADLLNFFESTRRGVNSDPEQVFAKKGVDIRANIAISFKEAMAGCKKTATVQSDVPCVRCDGCHGKGYDLLTGMAPCPGCKGQGQVTRSRGFQVFSVQCPSCSGHGSVGLRQCAKCKGQKELHFRKTITIVIPAGITNGQELRISGQGPEGFKAPAGDIYIKIIVIQDNSFNQIGSDIHTIIKVNFLTAIRGGAIPVELPGGHLERIEIAPGSQTGDIVSTPNAGAFEIGTSRRGVLHTKIEISVPKKLSPRAKKLLEELEQEFNKEMRIPNIDPKDI